MSQHSTAPPTLYFLSRLSRAARATRLNSSGGVAPRLFTIRTSFSPCGSQVVEGKPAFSKHPHCQPTCSMGPPKCFEAVIWASIRSTNSSAGIEGTLVVPGSPWIPRPISISPGPSLLTKSRINAG